MVKKLKQLADKQAKAKAGGAGLLDGALAGAVKDSAQQIWLAGMGAFSKAQEEGGKVFEALVKEGLSLQRRTQSVAEEKLGEVTQKMTGMAGEVQAKAGQHWDKLESIFEERTAKALKKLGVPTAAELAALQAEVAELRSALGLRGTRAAKPAGKTNVRVDAKPAAPKRPAVRKTAPKAAAPAAETAPATAPRKRAARRAATA